MTIHRLAGATLVASLLAACAAAPPHRPAPVEATAPDPDRWDRAACRLGEYPPELGARAFARARQQDLHARQRGEWSPFATARVQSEREAFDARCDALLASGTRL